MSALVDRFICRREGHKPTFTLTTWPPGSRSYITTCQRCGEAFVVTLPKKAAPP